MEEHFSLRWNNFHKNMSAGFQSLLLEDSLVDVTLAAGGKFLQAHRLVLSVCSPYFKQLFAVNPCKHPIVILKDVQYKQLADMLNFMYRGEVNVCQDDLADFLKTAELLQIRGLADQAAGSTQEVPSPEQRTSGERDSLPPTSSADQRNTPFGEISASTQQPLTLNENSQRQISGQNCEQGPVSNLPQKRLRQDTHSPTPQNITVANETPTFINLVPKVEPPDMTTAHTSDIESLNLLEAYHGAEPGEQTDLIVEEPAGGPAPVQPNYNVQPDTNVGNSSQEDTSFRGCSVSAAPTSSGMITRRKALMSSNNGLKMNLRKKISAFDWIIESLQSSNKRFGMTLAEIKEDVLNKHKIRETSIEKAVKLGIVYGYFKQTTDSGASGKIIIASHSKSKTFLCCNSATACYSSLNHQDHSVSRQSGQKGRKESIITLDTKRSGEVARRKAAIMAASRVKSLSTSKRMQVLIAAKKIKTKAASRQVQRLRTPGKQVEHSSLTRRIPVSQQYSSASSKDHTRGNINKYNENKRSQVSSTRKTL